eukprot:6945781-Karenia_brevis.AAC.1
MRAHRFQNEASKRKVISARRARKRLVEFQKDAQRDAKFHKWVDDPMFARAFLDLTADTRH